MQLTTVKNPFVTAETGPSCLQVKKNKKKKISSSRLKMSMNSVNYKQTTIIYIASELLKKKNYIKKLF